MIYSNFNGSKISMLGFGSMRLPTVVNDGDIDIEKTRKLVETAFESGIDYFDTAWGYHEGNSETVLGSILKYYPRDSFYISTKFPSYDVSNFGKHKEIFEKQLEKCQTDYFDFYFLHNICELNIDRYLDEEKYHTVEYFLEQKAKGRIKHLGFSAHGSVEVMKKFLDKFGKHMEFGMVQLNYIDYYFQGAKEKIELLNSWNIPIWVMEPLRGGMLAKMPQEHFDKLKKLRENSTPVEWAFRFIQSQPGVTVILSGMSDLEQMREKIEIFNELKPLNKNESETLHEICQKMIANKSVPCTECKYCLTHCPKGINIPLMLRAYNEHLLTDKKGFIAPYYIRSFPKNVRPSACIGCKACEKVCTQNLKISDLMKTFGKEMDSAISTMFPKES